MGKNYDAYNKALQAQDAARDNMVAANGGSSKAGMTEATNNAKQADAVVNDAWERLLADPEG